MDHLTEEARALLRAAREIHAEHHGSQAFAPGTYLPLEAAGERIGINPDHLRYYDVIKRNTIVFLAADPGVSKTSTAA